MMQKSKKAGELGEGGQEQVRQAVGSGRSCM